MNVVEAYLLSVGCQGDNRWGSSGEFFVALAGVLIEITKNKGLSGSNWKDLLPRWVVIIVDFIR
jgi:hypothetical protein